MCFAHARGALFFNDQSNSALIEDCTFTGNKAFSHGGSLFSYFRVAIVMVLNRIVAIFLAVLLDYTQVQYISHIE
jgi:hypothetical protein